MVLAQGQGGQGSEPWVVPMDFCFYVWCECRAEVAPALPSDPVLHVGPASSAAIFAATVVSGGVCWAFNLLIVFVATLHLCCFVYQVHDTCGLFSLVGSRVEKPKTQVSKKK